MQSIPSNLLNKLGQNLQTMGNNAQPKMEVIAQKASKYISQGNYLRPRTVRTGNDLGCIDVCIRRENVNLEPSEIIMVYIENGDAKVASIPYIHRPDQEFTYQYTIGPADEVACDFDGRWQRITDRTGMYFDTNIRWSLVTFGEPYISTVKDGVLTVRHGKKDPITLVDGNVLQCVMIRGWKSTTDVLTDQGVICAYTKTDGRVYYRNYCEQEDGTYIWEPEKLITALSDPVDDIGIFRSYDYRVGFVVGLKGNIKLLMTDRSWSGMATDPDHITANLIEPIINVIPIQYTNASGPDEYVRASIIEPFIYIEDAPYAAGTVTISNVTKLDATRIKLTFNYPLDRVADQQSRFSAPNITFRSTSYGDNEYQLILESTNPISSMTNIDISYTYDRYGIRVKIGNAKPNLQDITFTLKGEPPNVSERISYSIINPVVSPIRVYYKDIQPNNYMYHYVKASVISPSVVFTRVGQKPL